MRTYSFEIAVYYAAGVEITKPFCHLEELSIQSWVSDQPVESNDGDDTKRVRETFGFESRYWMILPESAQS